MPASNPYGESHVLERSGCRIHFWLRGPSDRPLVVLSHGAALDHRTFAPQVPVLAHTHRVLTWDMPGHGRSLPAGPRLSVRRIADDLATVVGEAGSSRAAFVGQSLGADVTQELVLRHPPLVSRVVLIGGMCLTSPRPLMAKVSAHLAPFRLRFANLPRLRRRIAEAIAVHDHVRDEALAAMQAMPRKTMVRIWSAIARAPHAEPGHLMPRPCLLLVGERDDLGGGVLRKDAEAWARRDPNCRLVPVPGAAHLANQDNPAFVNERVGAFLLVEVLPGARD